MNDVLIPLCRRYQCNLVTGAGEMSITSVLDLISRIRRADRPCCILYIADFDPAGAGMPISVARKLEFYIRQEAGNLDVRLHQLVLTLDQVHQYNLPTSPIKPSEARRRAFMERFGVDGAVELDALEALVPGELARIVTDAIEHYHDPDIEDRAHEAKDALAETLAEERQTALAALTDEWEECALQAHRDVVPPQPSTAPSPRSFRPASPTSAPT